MLADLGYKYCPRCGTAFEKRRLKEFEPERLVCPQCAFVFYLNPKVAAGAVVEYEGGIVLLRREIDPRAGFWVHPGGFVDRGETLEAAARRETREEVGLEVEIGRLLGAYSFQGSDVVVVTFAARALSGIPIVGDESLEVATFKPGEIPWDELAFPSTRLALDEYLNVGIGEIASGSARGAGSEGGEAGGGAKAEVRPRGPAGSPGRLHEEALAGLFQARADAFRTRDVRAGSIAYPALIAALRQARLYREALDVAEEGLALTHDPLIARLADEVAHELSEAEQERC